MHWAVISKQPRCGVMKDAGASARAASTSSQPSVRTALATTSDAGRPQMKGSSQRLAAGLDDRRTQHRLVLATDGVEEVLAHAAGVGRRSLVVNQPAQPPRRCSRDRAGEEEAECALRQHQVEIRYGCGTGFRPECLHSRASRSIIRAPPPS